MTIFNNHAQVLEKFRTALLSAKANHENGTKVLPRDAYLLVLDQIEENQTEFDKLELKFALHENCRKSSEQINAHYAQAML